jgi:hypothetical protein
MVGRNKEEERHRVAYIMQLQLLLTHYYTDVQSQKCLQDASVDVGTTKASHWEALKPYDPYIGLVNALMLECT